MKKLFHLLVLILAGTANAQNDATYQVPPKDIYDLVMAPPTPSVSIDSKGEWMIIMEFRDMAQMETAFRRVAKREGELEDKHRSFNQFVSGNIQHALFRDWPDQVIQ